MDPIELAARKELTEACHHVYRSGLVVGAGGNVSIRCGSQMLVTPTGRNLGMLVAEDLVLMTMDGTVVGPGDPSKEWRIHLDVLKARPDVTAVVHVHPVYAVAVSCMEDVSPEMAMPIYSPGYGMRVGLLPMVPFYMSGSVELSRVCAEALRNSDACLMANHGIVTVGRNMEAAIDVAEELEGNAQVHVMLNGKGRSIDPLLFDKVRRQKGLL